MKILLLYKKLTIQTRSTQRIGKYIQQQQQKTTYVYSAENKWKKNDKKKNLKLNKKGYKITTTIKQQWRDKKKCIWEHIL